MKKNLLLFLAAMFIATSIFLLNFSDGAGRAAFKGTDSQAVSVIQEISPGYKPWFAPLWDPSERGAEGLLFSLQTALGAGVIGYCLYKSNKNKRTS